MFSGGKVQRYFGKKENKRALLQAALAEAGGLVDRCMSLADEYYTANSDPDQRSLLARQIRQGMHALGCKIREVDLGLVEGGAQHMDRTLVIKFRQALTHRLDEKGMQPVSADNPLISEIHRSAAQLTLSLARLKFEHA